MFADGRKGYFFALDACTGNLLWKTPLGVVVASGPISYMVNGKQYISVNAGSAMFVFAVRQEGTYRSGRSIRPSRSKISSMSCKAALMLSLGNRICPMPSMFENSSQPSSSMMIALLNPRCP